MLAMGRADVNRYIRWLKGRKLAVNSVRLAVAAAATFWGYLSRPTKKKNRHIYYAG